MSDIEDKIGIDYALRFGELAIAMGFITIEDLKQALEEQISHDLSKNNRRLIGEILFDKDLMTLKQIDLVMREIFHNQSQPF